MTRLLCWPLTRSSKRDLVRMWDLVFELLIGWLMRASTSDAAAKLRQLCDLQSDQVPLHRFECCLVNGIVCSAAPSTHTSAAPCCCSASSCCACRTTLRSVQTPMVGLQPCLETLPQMCVVSADSAATVEPARTLLAALSSACAKAAVSVTAAAQSHQQQSALQAAMHAAAGQLEEAAPKLLQRSNGLAKGVADVSSSSCGHDRILLEPSILMLSTLVCRHERSCCRV